MKKPLKGKQKKLDANKNNRIDKQDFALLRKKNKKNFIRIRRTLCHKVRVRTDLLKVDHQ